jgi:hypothetical protein
VVRVRWLLKRGRVAVQDAIHSKDGKDYILEINDTASGFAPANMEEDMRHVRDLVLQRMHEAYPDD